jgi:capsular polysaccharide biosynthesis protein
VGFGFLAEVLDRRIRSVGDITENLGLPVLAVIATLSGGKASKKRRA